MRPAKKWQEVCSILLKPGHCFNIFLKLYIWIWNVIYKIQIPLYLLKKSAVVDWCHYSPYVGVGRWKVQIEIRILSWAGTNCCNTKVRKSSDIQKSSQHSSRVFTPKLKRWLWCCCSSFCLWLNDDRWDNNFYVPLGF